MSDHKPPSIFRRLWSLSLPVIGLNVLSVLALAVDTAMCGRLPESEAALAGLGFATQLLFLFSVAVSGLTVGTVAMLARAHGAGDSERVRYLLAQSSTLTGVVGLVVAAVGIAVSVPLLEVLGAQGAALSEGYRYLTRMLAASPIYFLVILLGGVLRGVGDTRIAFVAALFGNVVNVAVNYCLIYGHFGLPALGVEGAAIGTVVAQGVNLAILVVAIHRGSVPGLTMTLRPRFVDRVLAHNLWRLGWPVAVDVILINMSFLSIVWILARLDSVAVGAHGIGLRVQGLAFVVGLAISRVSAALVGQALGSADEAAAREVSRISIFVTTGVMSVLGFALVVFAHPIVALFDAPAGTMVHDYSVDWIRLLGVGMPFIGSNLALTGTFHGAGATFTPLRINILSTLLVQLPASIALAFGTELGVVGAWLGFPLAYVAKVMMSTLEYRRGRWMVIGPRHARAVGRLP